MGGGAVLVYVYGAPRAHFAHNKQADGDDACLIFRDGFCPVAGQQFTLLQYRIAGSSDSGPRLLEYDRRTLPLKIRLIGGFLG